MKSLSFRLACAARLPLAFALLAGAGCAPVREKGPLPVARPAEQAALAPDVPVSPGEWPLPDWWRRYGDPQLDALLDKALRDAPDMAEARARVALAQARARGVAADAGPQVDLSASVDEQHISKNGFLGPYGQAKDRYTEGTAGVSGRYEIDLWGANRARVAAALGVARARQAEAANVARLLGARLLSAYYAAQTAHAESALLAEAQAAGAVVVQAHAARYRQGLEAETAVEAARAQLLSLDRQRAETGARLAALREEIRALAGLGPDDPLSLAPVPLPEGGGGVPATLGYELLARRPDLRASAALVEASLGSVAAARAAFYPRFDIRAMLGLDAIRLGDLFRGSSVQAALIPGLSLPIFDSGRLNAQLSAARAQTAELVAAHDRAVLDAVREVAQAAIEQEALKRQAALQADRTAAVAAAWRSLVAQSRRGLTDAAAAREAQIPVIRERMQDADLHGSRIQADIRLMTALGG